jgi:hypothetical protein
MTVPTRDRAPRGLLLRRAFFAATALALTAVFALSLAGIASTQGTVRPDGQAAMLAAAKQRGTSGDEGATSGRHHCRRGDRAHGASRPV